MAPSHPDTTGGSAPDLQSLVAAVAQGPDAVSEVARVARREASRGEVQWAEDLVARASRAVPGGSAARWRLAATAELIRLDRGSTDGDWADLVRALLAAAESEDSAAPDLVADATDLAFHRSLQFDSPDNPLAADPAGFLEPFTTNRVVRRALDRSREPRAPSWDFRGYDAVLVSQGNLNFASGVRAALTARFATVSDVDLQRYPDEFPRDSHGLVADVLAGRQDRWRPATDLLMGKSRLVWAEWAQRQAMVPSHALPDGPRLVVRLHAYEVFTAVAQFIDWRRVDELVVVSSMMARAARRLLPLPPDLPVTVVGNHLDAGRFTTAKDPDARFTLALVGHNSAVKDPDFALDVLDAVGASEPRARLRLVGDLITPTGKAQGWAAAAYTEAFLRRLQEYLADGRVEVTGATDDVPGELTSVGFILSTSRRESFHQGLIEGALSGAVAVTRDWPIMAPFGGPGDFLPQRWVGCSAAECAARITPLMADPEAWDRERQRCRAEALAVIANRDELDRVLAG
ncbi:MAG: hypothetical protein U0R64_01180 [Candidatus Nanopelagicales bacterium]